MTDMIIALCLIALIVPGGVWIIRRQKTLPSLLNGSPATNFVPDFPPIKQRRRSK